MKKPFFKNPHIFGCNSNKCILLFWIRLMDPKIISKEDVESKKNKIIKRIRNLKREQWVKELTILCVNVLKYIFIKK